MTSPTIFAHHYYMAGKAVLLGLEQVDGDLSNQHKGLRASLNNLEFVTPTGGTMRIDENRNGIIDNFVTEVYEREDGSLGNRVLKLVSNVNQTMGQDPTTFRAIGAVSRENPSCP